MSQDFQKDKKRSPLVTGLIILFILVALYLLWSYIAGDLWIKPISGPDKEPKISWLKKPAKVPSEQTLTAGSQETPTAVSLSPGEESPLPPSKEIECQQTAEKIRLFFEHLDSQAYIKKYRFKESSLEHFNQLIIKLLVNPPIVVRETDDLFAILNNMAHLYRILGTQDVLLVKDVLLNEKELIEPTFMLFNKWSIIESQCTANYLPISLPLPGLYQYSGFFLNTLGGQSYLLRRDIYIRVLLRYYSILTLDRANNEGINIYGIDVRYHLNSVIDELEVAKDLSGRENYILNLLQLQKKYQAEYGN